MSVRRGVFGGLVVVCLAASLLTTGLAGAATPPPNDSFSNAQVLPAQLSGSVTGTTDGATVQAGEPNHAGYSANQTVWYRFTASKTSTTYFSAWPNSEEYLVGAIAVYRGTSLSSLTPVTSVSSEQGYCVDQGFPPAAFAATSGVTYYVAVATRSAEVAPGGFTLFWEAGGPPPANDAFANAQPVNLSRFGAVGGTSVDATTEAGDQSSCDGSVWFRFTPTTSGTLGLSTNAFGETWEYEGPPITTLFRGTSLASLVWLGGTADDTGSIYAPVTAGTTYYASVGPHFSKFDGVVPGPFELSWEFSPTIASATNAISVFDTRTLEGGSARFLLTRSGDLSIPASVTLATANGTALAGPDYAALPAQTVGFGSGQASTWVTVATSADSLGESNETFKLNLSSPVGAVLADSSATAVITDAQFNEPTYTIGDVSVKEGSTATFTITRRGDLTLPGSVKAVSASGTASAPGDFTALASTTVSFASGQSTRTVSVATKQNTVNVTTNKTFKVNLSSPVNGWTSDTSATATIVDDEGTVIAGPATWYSVDGVRVTEGNWANVTIRRRGAVTGPGSVQYATANGSATSSSDYTAVPLTTVNFAAGQSTATFSVPTAGDTRGEVHESVLVNLSASTGGAIEDSQGVISIQDDDDNPGPPQITVNNVRVVEGSAAVFTIIRAGDVAESVSVKYATANGTATSGSDYTARSSTTVTFAPGEWIKTVSVATLTDTRAEGDESFYLNLSSPVNATVVDSTGTATLANKG